MSQSDRFDTSWSSTFLGVFTEPETTFQALLESDGSFSDEKASQLFFLVIFQAIGSGLILANTDQQYLSFILVLFSMFSGLTVWAILAFLLTAMAKFRKVEKIDIKTSVILTGWAHLPLILYPPLYCLKGALGGYVEILSLIPFTWFVFLLLVAYKTSLSVSYPKVLFIFFVTPPLIALMVLFWIYILISYATLKAIPLII